jgi:restriction endonuclease S subunit
VQISGTGSDRPRVDFEKLSGFSILLPPVAEQGRIVARLNAAFSALQRADSAVTRGGERVYAELRELTVEPAKIAEERRGGGRILLMAIP